jgi:succinate-semialdehyde dehydrogenase/glutarate-semialdehyde dehydrogenase
MEPPEREDVLRVPFGVAALIVPWNFPLSIAADSLPALLVTGNTVVLKPSELAPLACARAAELIADLVPVFILHGGPEVGRALVADERVDIVVFTGSERTGREIGEVCGRRLVPALLELGGKDPVVVDAGVDPEWAAEVVATGAFMHTGQICTSMERIYVHRDVAEPFVEALVRRAREQRLGPLISERQREIVERHVAEAVAGGAEVLTGGVAEEGDGYFFPATVLTGVRDDMIVMREETFGPLAPVAVVDSFEEAVERAADSSYGLGATVLTQDDERAAEASRRIPAGIVWVNGWQMYGEDPVYEPARASGVGKVGGSAMLEAVTRPQHVARAPR